MLDERKDEPDTNAGMSAVQSVASGTCFESVAIAVLQ